MTHPSPEFLDLQTALAGEYSLQRELGLHVGASERGELRRPRSPP